MERSVTERGAEMKYVLMFSLENDERPKPANILQQMNTFQLVV